jgi:hypothetical protein
VSKAAPAAAPAAKPGASKGERLFQEISGQNKQASQGAKVDNPFELLLQLGD